MTAKRNPSVSIRLKQNENVDSEIELQMNQQLCLTCNKVFEHSEFYSHSTGMDRNKLGQHDGHYFVTNDGKGHLSIVLIGSGSPI